MGMARLIDLVEREAVKDAIGFMNLHFLGHGENKSLLDSINEVPSVDAVPVVRCKDCGAYNTDGCAEGFGWCVCCDKGMMDNDYCSHGGRRTNERL